MTALRTKPDTGTALSDSHSIEFAFECLDIEVDGLMFAEVSGSAELALNDPRDGDFYVKHIVLNGDRYRKIGPYATIKKRDPSKIHLWRVNESRTFQSHLFRAIEAALYRYQPALDAWQAELEYAD